MMKSPVVVAVLVNLRTQAKEAIGDEKHGVAHRPLCPFHAGMTQHARCRHCARAGRSGRIQPVRRFARAAAAAREDDDVGAVLSLLTVVVVVRRPLEDSPAGTWRPRKGQSCRS